MFKQMVHRIAMLAAIAGVTAVMNAPCQAGFALSTPAGLTAGETFRIVFVTDGTTNATSSNISSYDTFVTAQAGGATYNGMTVSWSAIGSTATVNAVDHVGLSTAGVFLASGTEVATSTTANPGGLWSGTLLNPIDQDLKDKTLLEGVWTGTAMSSPFGHTSVYPLGDSTDMLSKPGYSGASDSSWIASTIYGNDYTLQYGMYGISGVLTVPAAAVPEPSSIVLLGLGGIGLVYVARKRQMEWQRGRR